MSEAELVDHLGGKGVPTEHIKLILHSVFGNPGKNRRSRTQIRRDFWDHGHLVIGFTEYQWATPKPHIFQKIYDRGHHYSFDDLMTGELIAVVKRT
jgi:hypothetical protein